MRYSPPGCPVKPEDRIERVAVVGFGRADTPRASFQSAIDSFAMAAPRKSVSLGILTVGTGHVADRLAVRSAFAARGIEVTMGPDAEVGASAAGSSEVAAAIALLSTEVDTVLLSATTAAMVVIAANDHTEYYEFGRIEPMTSIGHVPAETEHLRFLGDLCAETVALVETAVAGFGGTEQLSCVLGHSVDLGIAGLVGVISDMYHAALPPTPSAFCELLSTAVDLTGTPFCFTPGDQPWLRKTRDGHRLTAVCGVGSLVVISSKVTAASHTPIDWVGQGGPAIVVLGGDSGPDLIAKAGWVHTQLASGVSLSSLTSESARRPVGGTYRAVFVAHDSAGMLRELEAADRHLESTIASGTDWATPGGSFCTGAPLPPGGRVAFVYPGTYAMYPGAERGLFQLFPGLLAGMEQYEDRPFDALAIDTSYLRTQHPPTRAEVEAFDLALRSDVGFLSSNGVYLGMLTTPLLRDFLGITPDGALGYSMGELTMLFGFEVWAGGGGAVASAVRGSDIFRSELYGARTVVRDAWSCAKDVPDGDVWATVAVSAAASDVARVVGGFDKVFITHINTADEVLIAGDPAQCTAVVDELDCKSFRIPGGGPVLHVPLVDAAASSVRALTEHGLGEGGATAEVFFAGTDGEVDLHDQASISDAIYGLCRQGVDYPSLCDAAYDRGYRYFIEVGPGADCSRWIGTNLAGRQHVAVSIDRRGTTVAVSIARALARLISAGLDIDLTRIYPEEDKTDGVSVTNGAAAMNETEWVVVDDGVQDSIEIDYSAIEPVGEVAASSKPGAVLTGRTQTRQQGAVRQRNLSAPVGRILADGLAASASGIASAHIAALEAQGALQRLALRELERPDCEGGGTGAATSMTVRDAFVPRIVTVEEGVDGELRTVIAEFDFAVDNRFTIDGRLTGVALQEALFRAIDAMKARLCGDLGSFAEKSYLQHEIRQVFRSRLPVAGRTLSVELTFSAVRRRRDDVDFDFSGSFRADGHVIAGVGFGHGGFHGTVVPRALARLSPVARSLRTLRRKGYKPLAYSDIGALSSEALAKLTRGDLAGVFGPRWDQRVPGTNRSIRISPEYSPVLSDVPEIVRFGGEFRLGKIVGNQLIRENAWYSTIESSRYATVPTAFVSEAANELLKVFAIYLGLHLVFPDAEFQPAPGIETVVCASRPISVLDETLRYSAEITDITMIPRPTVVADVHVTAGSELVATLRDVAVEIREKPGSDFRPELRDGKPVFLGRMGSQGEPAFVNEFHLSHMENGELEIAMGRLVESYEGKTVLHIPLAEFRFVDRIITIEGGDEKMRSGRAIAEYDAAMESWYYEDNSFAGMPGSIIMESSLQAAAVTGTCLGTLLLVPPDAKLAVRNLDGTARILADLDVRGKTLRQTTNLMSTTHIAGQILQRFSYVIEVDGTPYYEGQSLFGYFTAEALASQVGLDGGKDVPCWLDTQDGRDVPVVTEIDFRTDDSWYSPAPTSGLYIGGGHFRLIDSAVVVPGGGRNSLGYLKGVRHVMVDDWYFDCHFFEDPVMPGSLGVEAVMQGLQTYVMATDLAAGMGEVEFALAIDVDFSWSYRGQILRGDDRMEFELDVKEVRDIPRGLLVIADANVYKPGMRIYHLTNVALEVRPVTGIIECENP